MTRINIRTKGASAERDIADQLNQIIRQVLTEYGYSESDKDNHSYFVQRNQNQTAVGGNDLVNTYGFGIEVKRQEALSINTWWKQCVVAATKQNQTPVLLYRQSRKPWMCVMEGYTKLPNNQYGRCRMEIEFSMFLKTFEIYVRDTLTRI